MTEADVKAVIVKLRKAGVTSEVIAKAFGLKRQQVAAYVAWEHPTLSAKRDKIQNSR
jgi:uncharacterized protein (DUF433 family)